MSELKKFLFEGLPVRGMLVRLTDSWQEVLRRRAPGGAYPAEVRSLLGEMLAAGSLMQGNIKFNGALVLQLHGDGPVKLAVAEVQADQRFRATAKVVGEVPAGAQLEALVNVHGLGRCAITLDPQDRQPGQQPYQGVVALHGDQREPLQQLAQVLEHYMLQSEQLEHAADPGRERRCCRRPADSAPAGRRQWQPRRQCAPQRRRDRHQRGLQPHRDPGRHLDARGTAEPAARPHPAPPVLGRDPACLRTRAAPRFACTCSRERVQGMLRGLGRDESDSLIAERGLVEVGCEFCGLQYRFDAVDVGEMFTPVQDQPPSSPAVQ